MDDLNAKTNWQNMQRSTPFKAEAYAQQGEAAFQPQQPNMGGAGAAAGEAFDKGTKILIGAAAVKAGANHYQQTGDASQALQTGAVAYVRWMVFFLAICMWFALFAVTGLNGGRSAGTASVGGVHAATFKMLLLFGITPFLFGVNWCRNIDFCLFRRGLIYKLYAPIAQVTEIIPTWALYALLLVPVVL